jgi:hypothetical protein
MKISSNNEVISNISPDKRRPDGQAANADFKNILKESVAKSAPQATQPQSTSLLNALSAIRFNAESPHDKASAIRRVDSFIGLLDDYRRQLADPAVSLRSIEPVIKTIVKEKEQLSTLMDSLPDGDGLKDIVNRTLITASLEVIKYTRGDYISS